MRSGNGSGSSDRQPVADDEPGPPGGKVPLDIGDDTTAEVVAESLGTSAPRAIGLIRSGILISIAVVAANGLNAVFQFLMARILEPAEFSLLATMFSAIVMVTVPLTGLQIMMAREVASRLPDGGLPAAGAALRQAVRQLSRWILLILLITAVLAYPLIHLLSVDRPLPFIATGTALAVALPMPLFNGALQGTERFAMLSMVQPAYSLMKLIAGVTLGLIGFGASAVMFGVATATLTAMVVAVVPLIPMLRASEGYELDSRVTLVSTYSLGTAVGVFGYAIHTSIDIIVARIAFDATTAGLWAAAATVAKTILLVPSGVTTVLFPRVAKLRDRKRERTHMLGGIVTVAALACLVATLYFVFSDQIVAIAFGPNYSEAANWIGPLSFTMVLFALVQVYLFHFLALGGIRYAITVTALVPVQVTLFLFLHSTPEDLIIVQAIAGALLLVVGEYYHRVGHGRPVSGFESDDKAGSAADPVS